MKIIECVPNFSEGNDKKIISKITDSIQSISNITLLDIDPGKDTNRTVVTFVGEPCDVIEAAFRSIKIASQLIDMTKHKGEHSRMGATDVCPLIPISDVTIDECIKYSNDLAKKVSTELNIPVFMYEYSATDSYKKNLANIRKGEFEGMDKKIKLSKWKPDYGPSNVHPTAGVTAIGVRNFLIAYNLNINSKDKKIATDIALDLREQGRNLRNNKGLFVRDKNGIPIKKPGILKSCKAVGWYIDEYKSAQVSMNLTNIEDTSIHKAFEETRKQARKRGTRVTGSEIVGLVPLKSILNAGKYYLKKQKRSIGIPEPEIINMAIKSMGLNEVNTFDPFEKIIEYKINNKYGPLSQLNIHQFCNELSSDSPAPGGGSASALSAAISASLTSMVANLTFGKKQWLNKYNKMCSIAEESQSLKDQLIELIDKDCEAFNLVMDSYKLPNKNEKDINKRTISIELAMKNAANIPFETLKSCFKILKLSISAANHGNSNSITDAGVAGELAFAGANGAAYNIYINLADIHDKKYCSKMKKNVEKILSESKILLNELRHIVINKIDEK